MKLRLDKYNWILSEENYKAIIKIREKYYSFNYTYSPFDADDYDADQELREIKPTNVVVTKYI